MSFKSWSQVMLQSSTKSKLKELQSSLGVNTYDEVVLALVKKFEGDLQ